MRPDSKAAAVPLRLPRRGRIMALAICLLLHSDRSLLAAEPTPQQDVEGQLMCYCGCSDLTVRVCTCGTADAIRQDIAARLAEGQTPEQVVAAFVSKHGEQIRSAPTKSGFDLVAWVTPFVALALAGAALVLVVRRWGSPKTPAPAAAGGLPSEAERAPLEEGRALERVRREMRERR